MRKPWSDSQRRRVTKPEDFRRKVQQLVLHFEQRGPKVPATRGPEAMRGKLLEKKDRGDLEKDIQKEKIDRAARQSHTRAK